MIVRSHYPHWSARSGYRLLAEYLRTDEGLKLKEIVSGMSSNAVDNQWNHGWVQPPQGWYRRCDHLSECQAALKIIDAGGGLIHFFDGERGYRQSRWLARENRCRIMATYHQPPSVLEDRGLLGDGAHLNALDRLIIVSESQRSYFERYVAPAKIECIPHGVDTTYFTPRGFSSSDNGIFTVLTVGFWLRDLDTLLGACRRLLPKKEIRFRIVGLCAGRQVGALSKRHYLEFADLPNVELLDDLPIEGLLACYQTADILLLPMADCTANNVLLEAIACGLPVITTDLPGTRFYLEDCAVYIPPSDPNVTAEILLQMIDNPSHRYELGHRARKLAEDKLAWNQLTPTYARLYLEEGQRRLPTTSSAQSVRRALCTVITSDYLAEALALFASVSPQDACDFVVLVADNHYRQTCFERTRRLLAPEIQLRCLQDIQKTDQRHKDEDSLRWSLKPSLMRHLLTVEGYDAVIFADSDVCFFEKISTLFDRVLMHAIVLTPHWRPLLPNDDSEQFKMNFLHGLYNAGFVGASREGLAALQWWETACRYRCDKAPAEGFFVDQRYLDMIPVYFDNVHVLRDPGCNVAEWNADHLPRLLADGTLFVGCVPTQFIHFTGITIKKIGEGTDPALNPYLERYRELLETSERRIQRERLGLLKDHTPILRTPAKVNFQENLAVAWVVDYQTVVDALLQLETIKGISDVPGNGVWLMCSDFESYKFLRSKDLPETVHLMHWQQLENYRLSKIRKLYEGSTPFEGDHRRFGHACIPFFIKHLLLSCAHSAVLLLPPRVLWHSNPAAFLDWLAQQNGPVIADDGDDAMLFVYAQAHSDHLQLIGLWENRVVKVANFPPQFDISTTSQVSDWISLTEGQMPPTVFGSLQSETNKSVDKSSKLASWWVYKSSLLRFQNGRSLYGTEFFNWPDRIKANIFKLISRIIKVYSLVPSSTLQKALTGLPTADIVDTAINRAIDIRNVGNQMGERWNGQISDAMRAYLLYLIAVRYLQSGETERAQRLLAIIERSRDLISDLYRSKTLFHLASISEQKGRIQEAVTRYQQCLMHSTHHAAARSRLSVLSQQYLPCDEMHDTIRAQIG